MTNAIPETALECLLIADDLTGACDAAVHFAGRGHRTVVSFPDTYCGAAVAAVSTDSRDLNGAEIQVLMAQLAAGLPFRSARLVFKKIDSTLRGNGGLEIAAALRAFECDAAVVTPALPAMRRVVRAGVLRVSGDADFQPVDVLGWLRAQGVAGCGPARPGGIARAIAGGARVVSLDAGCDAELDRIAVEVLALRGRILWAGSAGLAAALARSLPPGNWTPQPGPVCRGAVLFCIGSNHAVTVTQQQALAAARRVAWANVEGASEERIAAALRRGQHVLIEIPRGLVEPGRLRDLIAGAPEAGLFVSGGDTASAVCRAVGARQIELCDEIVPGIPRGILRGGLLDGMTVVTKSGGFGDGDALIRVADYFSCPKN